MIDRILQIYEESHYDFRKTAFSQDPLAHLFPQWVDYYRMKAAIAEALQPKTILEIGVRFGYSAAAFLHGAPGARYIGIDSDSPSFGGSVGALDWARATLPAGQTELIQADSQAMSRFPGGIYDLIHIDGQQDGDGTFLDLEKALRQAHVILLDGYFWSTPNFLSANEFIRKYRRAIEYFLAIPGYAGDLIICVKPSALNVRPEGRATNSAQIRATYDSAYYLNDCGGWESFGLHSHQQLSDVRLGTLLDLAFVKAPQRMLDLGCGRGEITLQAARQGCFVTAVDYSPDAVEIVRCGLARESVPADRVDLRCADATELLVDKPVDVAVAGDLVEHLSPPELERLYANVAMQLADDGLFIVHTFPNSWFYKYDYPRRRRAAATHGAYLAPNPRSHYERLMHINEQSPRTLRASLRRHFPHVLLWFADAANPGGSLLCPMTPRQLAAQPDLYAIASKLPIDVDLISGLFRSQPLTEEDVREVVLISQTKRIEITAGAQSQVMVHLQNGSTSPLGAQKPNPVCFAYHWLESATRRIFLYEGERTRIAPCAKAGTTQAYFPLFSAPNEPGSYILQITLVQEGVRWFDWTNPAACVEIEAIVNSA